MNGIRAGVPLLCCAICGMFTSTFGGLIRDVLHPPHSTPPHSTPLHSTPLPPSLLSASGGGSWRPIGLMQAGRTDSAFEKGTLRHDGLRRRHRIPRGARCGLAARCAELSGWAYPHTRAHATTKHATQKHVRARARRRTRMNGQASAREHDARNACAHAHTLLSLVRLPDRHRRRHSDGAAVCCMPERR